MSLAFAILSLISASRSIILIQSMTASVSNHYLGDKMECCPYCQQKMKRRYESWSREEILILKAEIEFSRYGASKRAALVLNRDPSQVKAKMDQLSRMNRKSRDDIYARFGK